MILSQTFAADALGCLVAATHANYQGHRRGQMPLPPRSTAHSTTKSAKGLAFASLAHDYFRFASSLHVGHADAHETHTNDDVSYLQGLARQFMIVSAAIVRESDPTMFVSADLFVRRNGKVLQPHEPNIWPEIDSEHPLQHWARTLIEILQGNSNLPKTIGAKSETLEAGYFEIVPNDARIVQLDYLVRQIAAGPSSSAASQAHFALISINYLLIYSTGQLPDDAEFMSVGVNEHGYIIGCVKDKAE